jgi:hypothetical protein
MADEPSAASALYPHLKSVLPEELPPKRSTSLSAAMYPAKPSAPQTDPRLDRHLRAFGLVRKERR